MKIHKGVGSIRRTYNINKTYVDENNLRSVILTAALFTVCLTENGLKDYNPGQLRLGCEIILSIKKREIN